MTGKDLRQLELIYSQIGKLIADNQTDLNYKATDPAPLGFVRCSTCWRLYPQGRPHVCPTEPGVQDLCEPTEAVSDLQKLRLKVGNWSSHTKDGDAILLRDLFPLIKEIENEAGS